MKDKTSQPRRKSEKSEKVSQSEFARRVGCTRQSVADALKSGRIQAEADGKLDWAQGKRAWEQNVDRGQQRGNKSDEKWQEARTRRERAEADMAEIDLKKMQRSVVSVEEAQKEFFECSRLIRDRILQIPKRLAPMLIGLNERQVANKLQDELTLALTALKEEIIHHA